LVIAIGGNALADRHDASDLARQAEHARDLAGPIAEELGRGTTIAITHGNGPQVGGRLLENSAASEVPLKQLHTLVAETQGEIGHYLDIALTNELQRRGSNRPVVTLVTHVLVDAAAPEFDHPDKPVGPSLLAEEAQEFTRELGWHVSAQADGYWRRVVPSPRPQGIIEEVTIRQLVDAGTCVIAGGGGGVPVATTADGLVGVEAVIDKDYVACSIANAIGATRLVILTDVAGAALSYATPEQQFLEHVTIEEVRLHLERGEFAPGSMAPKVEACVEFVERSGGQAIIASTGSMRAALVARSGTIITRA
jgi:carbamate kinase